jgi:hypothetical protein
MFNIKELACKLGPKWNILNPRMLERKAIIVSTCSCGIARTLKQFRELHLVGHQHIDDGQEPSRLEMRNCTCGSTRSIGFDKNGNYFSALK